MALKSGEEILQVVEYKTCNLQIANFSDNDNSLLSLIINYHWFPHPQLNE